jgi:hypothetical protein
MKTTEKYSDNSKWKHQHMGMKSPENQNEWKVNVTLI